MYDLILIKNESLHELNLTYQTIFFLSILKILSASIPRFDSTALFQNVLIPADAGVGTIIYRLRASDPGYNYPLIFSIRESTTVSIETLNCTRFNSVCQANIILIKRLEIGRYYDVVVDVHSQTGGVANLNCSFQATNSTTLISAIFSGAPTLLMVSEKSRRNTEIGTIIAKGNPKLPRPVLLELWGAPQFGLHQRLINDRDAEGTILLLSPLDYETQTVHHLSILANDPWTNLEKDTRNIASWPILIAVLDEQDTPPIFSLAPPTTALSPNLKPGDLILKVHAEDGDRGSPRNIRYGLVPENNPFTSFFNISEETGEVRMIRPLSDILTISHSGQPILLSVIAEEVRSNPQEAPSQSSTVQLALIPPGVTAGSPTFAANEYNTLLDENSPAGTILDLPQSEIITQPGDVVTLELINNNGTFDINPKVVEGHSSFQILVNNPKLLDYELWHSVHCFIVAKELGIGNFTAQTKLNVILNDINDNAPQFIHDSYEINVPEDARIGTSILQVEAIDTDREPNKIIYTKLIGPYANLFNLDPISGLITTNYQLDAEKSPIINLIVEAADNNGNGKVATSTITIHLIDINDELPIFEKNVYEFILNPERNAFTTPAFLKAFDNDISSPNNDIHYELIDSNDNLMLNEFTGELIVVRKLPTNGIINLRARAYDGGVPRLFSETEIRIYPPEGQSRKMLFIVPGRDPEMITNTLRLLTGGRVVINEIRPYSGYEPGATDVSGNSQQERSVVNATVSYSKDSVVDVNRIQKVFNQNIQQASVTDSELDRSGNWFWLLLLLITLGLLAAISLILCCICEGCPLYVPPKRKIVSSEIQKMVLGGGGGGGGGGQGKESKSVQVAEWFGRKEAWTPEVESLHVHEMGMGSDRMERRFIQQQQQQAQQQINQPQRDQYYIREGNTDILRLVTRGGGGGVGVVGDQRPVTLVAEPSYMIDGKDILMKRFIDQQEFKPQIILPNAVNKIQSEHELLETSIRQQNALLRQILLERDLRYETQSLPAGTQTDHDAITQTEPEYFLNRRKVVSDNDLSDYNSDDEFVYSKRPKRKSNKNKSHVRRKIKTPIQEEETEMEIINKVEKINSKPIYRQTRTSQLRQKAINKMNKMQKPNVIDAEVLKEISDSFDHSDSDKKNYSDSLEDLSPHSEKTTNLENIHYHSESDLREIPSLKMNSNKQIKSKSHTNLSKKGKKPIPRYMEWYTNNKKNNKKNSKNIEKTKEDEVIKETVKKLSRDISTSRNRKKNKSDRGGCSVPEHPLIQHSEYRFEIPPVGRRLEEDTDSGIALTKPPIAQKKSVFTIAYDDMQTKNIRPTTSTP